MIRKLIYYPNPSLWIASKSIDKITQEIKDIAYDMIDTMYHYNGVGISAIQVGIPLNLIVMDCGLGPEVFINTMIVDHSLNTVTVKEGCLSFPNLIEKVQRYNWIEFRYEDLDGNVKKAYASHEHEQLKNQCLQHEVDHILGKVFIDKLPTTRRELAKRKALKQFKQ